MPGVIHHPILDPVEHLVIHRRRGTGDLIETRIAGEGTLDPSPPGLGVPITALFTRA